MAKKGILTVSVDTDVLSTIKRMRKSERSAYVNRILRQSLELESTKQGLSDLEDNVKSLLQFRERMLKLLLKQGVEL